MNFKAAYTYLAHTLGFLVLLLKSAAQLTDVPLLNSVTCGPGASEVLVDGADSGIFQSPGWPNSYIADSRCLYRFIAPPGKKILLEFDFFYLEGLSPFCNQDFLDIYIDLASSQPRDEEEARFLAYLQEAQGQQTTTPFSALLFSATLSRSHLLGRFCGRRRGGAKRLHGGVGGGGNIPHKLVSIHRQVVMDFFAAPTTNSGGSWRTASAISSSNALGFNGTFQIIPDDLYYPGKVASQLDIPPLPSAHIQEPPLTAPIVSPGSPVCRFIISPGPGDESLKGEFVSPAYPGLHPPGLNCVYLLRGRPNQRVRVTIRELSLPSHDKFCPTHYMQFFDSRNAHPLLTLGRPFCGEQTGIEVVSTEASLLVHFVTGSNLDAGAASLNHRGFRVAYEFWDNFIQIEGDYNERHIRGTECDFVLRSGVAYGNGPADDRGVLESPNFPSSLPIHPGHVCSFFFLGRNEPQKMESVRVAFDILDLPASGQGSSRCKDGFLAVYGARIRNDDAFELHPVRHGEISSHDDNWLNNPQSSSMPRAPLTASQVWCGDKADAIKTGRQLDMSPLLSQRSALMLRFNASGTSPMNLRFRAFYNFTPDYGISGSMVTPSQCWFIYRGSEFRDRVTGWTNSPFFANTYPAGLDCLYLFRPDTDQSIRLSFTTFQTSEVPPPGGNTRFHQNLQSCTKDYLEVIEILDDFSGINDKVLMEKFSSNTKSGGAGVAVDFRDLALTQKPRHRRVNVFCGAYVPGPLILSQDARAFLLAFHTDEKDTGVGFQIRFQFKPKPELEPNNLGSCASGIVMSDENGGVLQSPGYSSAYPKNLNCQWKLVASAPAEGIMIHFTDLSVEGAFQDCKNVAIRIKENTANGVDDGDDAKSATICGSDSAVPAFSSSTASLTISLITNDQAVSSRGFKLTWTKLLPLTEKNVCSGFRCQHSGHCIPKQLECNGLANCGTYTNGGNTLIDTSDETASCLTVANYGYVHIGVGILLTIVLLAFLVAYIACRERRLQRKKALEDPLGGLDTSPGDNEEDDDDNEDAGDEISVDIYSSPKISLSCRNNHHTFSEGPIQTHEANEKNLSAPLPTAAALCRHHSSSLHLLPAGHCSHGSNSRSHSNQSSVKALNSPTEFSSEAEMSTTGASCPRGHHRLLMVMQPFEPPQANFPMAMTNRSLQLHHHHHHQHQNNICENKHEAGIRERMQKISIV